MKRLIKKHPVANVVGATLLAGITLLVARSLPDLIRYARIERM